jgi:hypothetical protein
MDQAGAIHCPIASPTGITGSKRLENLRSNRLGKLPREYDRVELTSFLSEKQLSFYHSQKQQNRQAEHPYPERIQCKANKQ